MFLLPHIDREWLVLIDLHNIIYDRNEKVEPSKFSSLDNNC